MEIEKHLKIEKTARCFFSHEPTGEEEEIVIVLHGYGQSARHFLKKFDPIANSNRLVVAPEGLHRFYTKGFSGRVGASWMTREDRLHDIDDYVAYLDQVVNLCHAANGNARISIIGFSQGAATATRWVCQGVVSPSRLILWAGSFPHDVDFPSQAVRLRRIKFELVIGDEDEFIKAEHIKDVRLLLDQNEIEFDLTRFAGGHDIDKPTLVQLFD